MWHILRIVTVLASAAQVLGVAAPVGNIFQVDFTQNTAGGCQYVGQANMQTVLDDCETLAQRGQQLINDYNAGVAEAIRLVNAFFFTGGNLTPAQTQQILTAFTTVRNYLTGTLGTTNGGGRARPPNPWLFCHHGWLQKKQASDLAQDTNGETYPGGNPADIGLETRISDTQAYANGQARYPSSLPYWSQRATIRGYIFDQGYGAGNAGYCSPANNLAATQQDLDPGSITMCPKGFSWPRNTPYPGSVTGTNAAFPYIARGSVNPTPQASVPAPTAGQNLGALLPTAATLFHELFHLVLGNAQTYLPGGGEEYDLFGCVGLAFASAIRNPESFTFVATAYDYTIQAPVVNGHRVEFFTGYTTQG